MANTDAQPATTFEGLLQYVAKYVSKPEKSSHSYMEIQRQLLPYINSNRPALSFVTKVLNRLVAERDFSAQEISHFLLNLHQSHCSREVVPLDCRPPEEQAAHVRFDELSNAMRVTRSKVQRYQDRPTDATTGRDDLDSLTLLEWLTTWDWNKTQKRPRASARMLNIYPRYDKDSPTEMEDYARVKLQLHHPWRQLEDLRTVDGVNYGSFAAAYASCQLLHHHTDTYDNDPADSQAPEDDEDDTESVVEEPSQGSLQAFELYAHRRPGDDLACPETRDDLGARMFDLEYDWSAHIGLYPEMRDSWWEEMQARYPASHSIKEKDSLTMENLNNGQLQIYHTYCNHFSATLRNENPPPLRLNIDGQAGTGKTSVILLICTTLREMAEAKGRHDSVLRAAPTGVAAHLFYGRTLHNLLRLPIKGNACLSPASVGALQERFQGVHYLIIDEKSMIGLA